MTKFILAKLLFITLSGGITAILTMLFYKFGLKNSSHHLKYYIWLLVIAAFLAPTSLRPTVNDSYYVSESGAEVQSVQTEPEEIPAPTAAEADEAPATEQVLPAPAPARQFNVSIPKIPSESYSIALAVWALGFVLLFGKKRIEALLFRRRLKRIINPADDTKMRCFLKCLAEMNIKGNVRLAEIDAGITPFLTGIIRPTVVIPSNVSAEKLPLIFRHELTHLKRRDLWYSLLFELVCQLHWFNPLVWLSARLRHSEMEFSCDEAVAARLDNAEKREYITAIMSIMRSGAQLTKSSACLSEGGMNIKKRMEIIMTDKKRTSILSAALAVCLMFCSVFTVYAVNDSNPVTTAYTNNHTVCKSLFSYTRECAPEEYGVDDNTGYGRGNWDVTLINTPVTKSFSASAQIEEYTLDNGNMIQGEYDIDGLSAAILPAPQRETKSASVQIEMTSLDADYGNMWTGKFTVTINGETVLENAQGSITNIPSEKKLGYTQLEIYSPNEKKSCALSNINFNLNGTDLIDADAAQADYSEKLADSVTAQYITLGGGEAEINGVKYSFTTPEEITSTLMFDPAENRGYFSYGFISDKRGMDISMSMFEKYAFTEDTISGPLYFQANGMTADCFNATISGLSQGDTVTVKSDDGRLLMTLSKKYADENSDEFISLPLSLPNFWVHNVYRENSEPSSVLPTTTSRPITLDDLPFTVTLTPDKEHVTIAFKENTGIARWHNAIATYNRDDPNLYETMNSGGANRFTYPLLTDGSTHNIYTTTAQYEPYAVYTAYDIMFKVVDGQIFFTNCSRSVSENRELSGYGAFTALDGFFSRYN